MTRPAVGSIAPVVTVNGGELQQSVLDSLIGMRIRSGFRLPAEARLEFLDEGFAISAGNKFSLGTSLVVKTGAGATLFTGEVTGVELDIDRGAPNMTVIAHDPAYKFTLGNKVRTFTKMTFSDIVSEIARDYGLTSAITSTTSQHDYVMQADTDFGFLSEVADRAGYDWWIDPEKKLQFHPMLQDSGTATELTWSDTGPGLRQFSVRASALHPQKVTVRGWDAGQAQAMTATSSSITGTPTAALVDPFVKASALSSHGAVTSGHAMYATSGDGNGLAKSAAIVALTSAVTAEGVCGVNPSIKLGGKVKLSEVGPASGTYSVTEVEQIYGARGFETRFVAGDRLPSGLVDSLSAPTASSFRQDMLVVGIVTNMGNSESPKGCIKVSYPTFGEQVESHWARVVAPGAGDTRGFTFLPEVNDEVIVGFEAGDLSRPIVLGGLYSGKNSALDYGVQDGKVGKRQIVSRLGHVIEMGDGEGDNQQHIALTLKGGEHLVRVGKDGLTAKMPSGQPIAIQAGDTKIDIDKQGNITMSGQKVTIKATQDVEISGMNVKIKANASVEASGMQVKVAGNGQAELSSGGMTSVKGATVAIN